MANSINWGEVYCFTYFGDEDNNTRAIGNVPTCFSNAFIYAEAYLNRVLADFGLVENYDCMENEINKLN
jgi:hypothetical protein